MLSSPDHLFPAGFHLFIRQQFVQTASDISRERSGLGRSPAHARGGTGCASKEGEQHSQDQLLPSPDSWGKASPALISTMRGSHPDFTAKKTKERKKERRKGFSVWDMTHMFLWDKATSSILSQDPVVFSF